MVSYVLTISNKDYQVLCMTAFRSAELERWDPSDCEAIEMNPGLVLHGVVGFYVQQILFAFQHAYSDVNRVTLKQKSDEQWPIHSVWEVGIPLLIAHGL